MRTCRPFSRALSNHEPHHQPRPHHRNAWTSSPSSRRLSLWRRRRFPWNLGCQYVMDVRVSGCRAPASPRWLCNVEVMRRSARVKPTAAWLIAPFRFRFRFRFRDLCWLARCCEFARANGFGGPQARRRPWLRQCTAVRTVGKTVRLVFPGLLNGYFSDSAGTDGPSSPQGPSTPLPLPVAHRTSVGRLCGTIVLRRRLFFSW